MQLEDRKINRSSEGRRTATLLHWARHRPWFHSEQNWLEGLTLGSQCPIRASTSPAINVLAIAFCHRKAR